MSEAASTAPKIGRDINPSITDAANVAKAVNADLDNGLTAQEATHRLAEFGPNELRARRRVHPPGVVSLPNSRIPSSTCCWPRLPSRSLLG